MALCHDSVVALLTGFGSFFITLEEAGTAIQKLEHQRLLSEPWFWCTSAHLLGSQKNNNKKRNGSCWHVFFTPWSVGGLQYVLF